MILTIRQQKAFVCPEVSDDTKKKEEAFAKASQGLKTLPKKKQPQVKVPRGGSRGRIRF